MLKRISIQVPGSTSPMNQSLVVTPESTAREILESIGLAGYELCPSLDQLPFGKDEYIFDKVPDGAVLPAYRIAEAGVTFFSPAPSLTPLLRRRGWFKRGADLFGYFRTPFGSFPGRIRLRVLGIGDYFIHRPPVFLKNHPHWACFNARDNGWYELHFNNGPATLDEGVKTIELMIAESYTKYN